MPKFRKKPVVIEAIQFTGSNWEQIGEVVGQKASLAKKHGRDILLIATLEGEMKADKGDWIIKGVASEFYPCKDAIFHATYEPVDDEDKLGRIVMEYKMRCSACGNRYIFVSRKVLKLPVRQECPKCKRWTGEPE